MTTAAADTEFFSLAPIGFADYEHTVALKTERGSTCFIRLAGNELVELVSVAQGGSLFNEIVSRLEQRAKWRPTHEQVCDRHAEMNSFIRECRS